MSNERAIQPVRVGPLLRLEHIIGGPDNPPLIPISKVTWYQWIADGIAPQSVPLGPRAVAWKVDDVLDLIERLERGEVVFRDGAAPLKRKPKPAADNEWPAP